MFIEFLTASFRENLDDVAIIWRDNSYSYRALLERLDHWGRYLDGIAVKSGNITAIEADFSPNAVGLMLALIERGCIIVPLSSSVAGKKPEYIQIAQAELCVSLDSRDEVH